MLRIILFALLCSVPGMVHAAATVLVFGDSVSAGYGLPQGAGWVDLLRARLAHAPYDYKVINASVSGETTLGGRNRLGATLSRDKPAVVIVALGGNDGLRGTSVDTISANLTAMIADCRAHGAKVMLVGMRVPPNYGSDYEKKFRALYTTVARTERVPLAPFLFEGFATDRDKFQADGIHPTVAAQAQMLDTVWRELRLLLVERRPRS